MFSFSSWKVSAINARSVKQRHLEAQAMRHIVSLRNVLGCYNDAKSSNDCFRNIGNCGNVNLYARDTLKQSSFVTRSYYTTPGGTSRPRFGARMTNSSTLPIVSWNDGRLETPSVGNKHPFRDNKIVRWSSTFPNQRAASLNHPNGLVLLFPRTREWDRHIFFLNQIQYFSTQPALNTSEEEKSLSPDSPSTERKRWTTTTNTPLPSLKLGKTAVPTPPSAPMTDSNPLQSLKGATPQSLLRKGMNLVVSGSKFVMSHLVKLPGNLFYYATHPAETKAALIRFRDMAKEEAHHYWVGTKLLWADIVTARKLLNKTLEGSALTRRERKQLLRTVSDLFRLIPFSMFVIVPFMEFALPFALRIFPNMLPSTYQDSLKAEENMKRELKSRIAMAQFFQE
jgi:LETM1-like protein